GFDKEDKENYTADSFTAYATAVSEGKNIYEDNDATQDDVNKAVDKIETAVNALKKKDLDSSEDDGEPNNTSGTGNNEDNTTGSEGEDSTNDNTQNTSSDTTEAIGEAGAPVVLANGPYDDMNLNAVNLSTQFTVEGKEVTSPANVKNGETANFNF